MAVKKMHKKIAKKAVKKIVKHSKHGVIKGTKTKLHLKPIKLLPMYLCRNPKCGHKWIPRTNEPLVCPVCHTKYS